MSVGFSLDLCSCGTRSNAPEERPKTEAEPSNGDPKTLTPKSVASNASF